MITDIKLFHYYSQNIIVWRRAIYNEQSMTNNGKLFDLPGSNGAVVSADRCSSYANKKKRREERAGQRTREKVANVRREAGKARNKAAGGPTKPCALGFTRSRTPLSRRLA